MSVDINLHRLQVLLAEMHSVLPDGYQVAFVARKWDNKNANIVLTDMKKTDLIGTIEERVPDAN